VPVCDVCAREIEAGARVDIRRDSEDRKLYVHADRCASAAIADDVRPATQAPPPDGPLLPPRRRPQIVRPQVRDDDPPPRVRWHKGGSPPPTNTPSRFY
jgi:hypothetical protein